MILFAVNVKIKQYNYLNFILFLLNLPDTLYWLSYHLIKHRLKLIYPYFICYFNC